MPERLRAERRARLAAAMAAEGINLLVVAGNPWRSDYLRFAVDLTPVEGQVFAFVRREGPTRVIAEFPAEAARFRAEQGDLQVTWSTSPTEEAEAALRSLDGECVALAPLAAVPQRLATGPLRSTMAAATALLDRLMLRKSPLEIAAFRRAAALADEGYAVFCDAARVGRPEYALVADVEAFFRSRGCPENFQILGSGGREVRGMHPPTERRLAPGDLVTTELTPCVDGYYAQICRTLVIGTPSEPQRRAFSVYDEALAAGIAAVRPGATAGEVARAQNEVFRRHGLGEYVTSEYTRVRGHGLGLYVDGRPALLEDVGLVLEAGMTLIVHPNTYHPEVGYFVHGDSVRVTNEGCEVLTRTPRRLFSVAAG
ncbi:MAG TPA: Xaa-Pro peptidase family protein [Burkholderiales bacterium]|nr:Xaa-Pro peptidase family protein [Burkholderiales bacterium]